ncbi:MAG TPA: hypothetical protein VFZ34_00115 [Blastocatellia bacterium]|nr:hypothetical protein [Blastocatellia bacterium]
MKKSTKILLGVLGGLATIFLIAVAIGIYWFSTSGKQFFERVMQSAEQQIEAGKEAGKQTDEAGCLNAGVERVKQADSMATTLAAQFYLRGCLESAKPTPGFCDDVPPESEIMKSIQWQLKKSGELGVDNDNGRQILKTIQAHCGKGRRGNPPNPPSEKEQ